MDLSRWHRHVLTGVLAVGVSVSVGVTTSGCHGDCGTVGAAIDYTTQARGEQTPGAAVAKFLQHRPAKLPSAGWERSGSDPGLVHYRSGSDRIDVSHLNGTWLVTGYIYPAC